MKEKNEEDESEESEENSYENNNNNNNIHINNYNYNIKTPKTNFNKYINNKDDYFNKEETSSNNSNNISFSPKKTKLSSNINSMKMISRNPNYNNKYNLNKNVFIPLNVMNLVAFINNSQTKEHNVPLSSLDTLSVIKPENNLNQNINLLNQAQSIININNANNDASKVMKLYKTNYSKLKNDEILSKTAFGKEPISPIPLKEEINYNNYNNSSFEEPNNKQENLNQINNMEFSTNFNGASPNFKFIHFNNVMYRKKSNNKINNFNNNN